MTTAGMVIPEDELAMFQREAAEYEDDDGESHSCMTCGGDGFAECDGDCPESDDCGCPYAEAHFICCPNCRGSGDAKDQWYW